MKKLIIFVWVGGIMISASVVSGFQLLSFEEMSTVIGGVACDCSGGPHILKQGQPEPSLNCNDGQTCQDVSNCGSGSVQWTLSALDCSGPKNNVNCWTISSYQEKVAYCECGPPGAEQKQCYKQYASVGQNTQVNWQSCQ